MSTDYVILLHGYWRSAKSMSKIEQTLSAKGYCVINFDYPSKNHTIENISNDYLKNIIQKNCIDPNKKINFVTHSMGGIIVRHFLANNQIKYIGRVVMIAPPNKGSKWANYLSKISIINKITDPALKQLTTHISNLPNSLPLPHYEVGIIAGKYDEKVSKDSTQLPNMKDFILIPHIHGYIMGSDKTIKAVVNFLEKGRF